MKIRDVVYAVGRSGYINKDLMAVKAGAKQDGFIYHGKPVVPGFKKIVQPGAVISVMLVLEDGQVAYGDCADVIFTGLAGRDPLFDPQDHLHFLRTEMRDFFVGQQIDRFKTLAEKVDGFDRDGRKLHTALRYGLTQAILHAAALANRVTMAEIVARDYGSDLAAKRIAILASCHRGDWDQLDRMVLKRVELLPHASFTLADEHLGPAGHKLIEYAAALVKRIGQVGDPDYKPTIHLDVYGTIGDLFGDDDEALSDFLGRVRETVQPYGLLVETPFIAKTKQGQMDRFSAVKALLRRKGVDMGLIADEWCNTLDDIKEFADAGACDYVQIKAPDLGGINNSAEAVLYCRSRGMGCCLGGTANESDISARVTANVALACQPNFLLSKPGLGADEGVMILTNEMERSLALVGSRMEAVPA